MSSSRIDQNFTHPSGARFVYWFFTALSLLLLSLWVTSVIVKPFDFDFLLTSGCYRVSIIRGELQISNLPQVEEATQEREQIGMRLDREYDLYLKDRTYRPIILPPLPSVPHFSYFGVPFVAFATFFGTIIVTVIWTWRIRVRRKRLVGFEPIVLSTNTKE